MRTLANTVEVIFFEDWTLEIDKSGEYLTVLTFDNRNEDYTRDYDILNNIISFEVEEFENRITLFSDTKFSYHINLSEEDCIVGDIYENEGKDFVDTFAYFDIND